MSSEARALKTAFRLGGSWAEEHSSEKEVNVIGCPCLPPPFPLSIYSLPTGDPAAQGCVQRSLLPDRRLTRCGGPREANQDAGHVVQAALERVEETGWRDTAKCPSSGLPCNLRVLFPAPHSGCVRLSSPAHLPV